MLAYIVTQWTSLPQGPLIICARIHLQLPHADRCAELHLLLGHAVSKLEELSQAGCNRAFNVGGATPVSGPRVLKLAPEKWL